MINRKEALKILEKNIPNENLRKHCYATEVVMIFLAEKFDFDKDKWALAGLLHDVDYMETQNSPDKHGLRSMEILSSFDIPEDVLYAIKVHNHVHGLPRKSLLDKGLYATDPVTGLIVASALIRPEKKLNVLDVDFLKNRFNEKSFARGANREQIATCKDLEISLDEFLEIALKAMQSIDEQLGL